MWQKRWTVRRTAATSVLVTKTRALETIEFKAWLQAEFSQRSRRNPRYSVRAFARLLQMDPSSVSQLLSGKRRASTKVIAAACDRLSARPEIRDAQMRAARVRRLAAEPAELPTRIAADAFAAIADWHHYAILELTFVDGFDPDPKWIARELRIGVAEARAAVDRLLRLGLLRREGGRLGKSARFTTNYEEGFTAPALKELQRQILAQALAAIDGAAPEDKDITSMTMAIDPDRLPEARRRIRAFRRELCAYLEQGKPTRVFTLGLQLFPVSEDHSNRKRSSHES